ncbi:thymidylate kinase [Pieris brassicae]|uniref:thymidylate kinase n=1 Tax=Pieris brassicae TaxID=7116 RepID=UPI001E6610AD|nr:thymidylate kinase [Pieris brassicae]XP_045520781.1 thymidylate kinase [Pieris brassicae]
MIVKRGALIVIEGVDRTGKTTQAKLLVESLKKRKIQAEYRNFPNRNTEIGKVINSYLTSQTDLPDEAIHLLFSANRWEKSRDILDLLEKGTTVIVDRYCYSGVAFSAAKGLDLNWCKFPDIGLPKPDKVFFLTLPLEVMQQRNGFGNERYEVPEFQKKVIEMYGQLKDNDWDIMNANRTLEVIQEELFQSTLNVINTVEHTSIGKLWVKK